MLIARLGRLASELETTETSEGVPRGTYYCRANRFRLRGRHVARRIEGQREAIGVQFAFEDLLIGATALHLGYEVATLNLRDFQRIRKRTVLTVCTPSV